MLVSPQPGYSREAIIQAMTDVTNGANQAHALTDPIVKYPAYVRWTVNAIRKLAPMVSARDLDRLVQSPRYWSLVGAGPMAGSTGVMLINLEMDERLAAINAAIKALEWYGRNPVDCSVPVVADTSAYLHAVDEMDAFDFAAAFGTSRAAEFKMLVPALVVEELDRAKRSENNGEVRARARRFIAILEDRFGDDVSRTPWLQPPAPIPTRRGHTPPMGGVTIELLRDDPGHVRLSNDDHEIVDRGLVYGALVGKRVTLFSCDTMQVFHAKGLRMWARRLPQRADTDKPSRADRRAAKQVPRERPAAADDGSAANGEAVA